MVYYSAIKMKKLLIHIPAWMKLQCFMLSERSQVQIAPCYIIPLYDTLEKAEL